MDTTTIINELTQGMESAMELNSIILSSNFSSKTEQFLIQQIISSYDRALLMVNSGGQTPPMLSQPEESSIVYLDESPRSQEATQDFDDQQEEKLVSEKKRKLAMPTWRNQIRISTENGFEGNTDDGYNWRKYGQKDILGSPFPRSYYRCTYRYVQHCMARKQVQRTNDPTVFEITYKGKHTCNPSVTPQKLSENNHQPPSPPKKLIATTSDMDLDAATVPSSFSFPPASFENYQQSHFLNETEYGSVLQGYPPFSSPGTSGSNYFHLQEDEYSNPSAASGSNYPQLDLSQDFAFNNPGYFNI